MDLEGHGPWPSDQTLGMLGHVAAAGPVSKCKLGTGTGLTLTRRAAFFSVSIGFPRVDVTSCKSWIDCPEGVAYFA